MILSSVISALRQLGDARFLKVVAAGIALAALLFVVAYYALSWVLLAALPDQITLPWIGSVHWLGNAAEWGTLALMLLASIFLMVPVATLFSGFFLETVADAVEDRYYPGLPPARPEPLGAAILGAAGFSLLVLVVNLCALVLYFLSGPFAPLVFWVVNGYLLGREYFQTVAIRRLGRRDAQGMRRAHAGTVWLAGALMAVPLTVPFVGLIVPVIGVATFTHLFHRLLGQQPSA